MPIVDRIKRGWNAFMGREPPYMDYGYSSTRRTDVVTLSTGADNTIITAIYNRIAMDVAAVDIEHVYVDQNEKYKEPKDSSLAKVLSTEPNIDQTGRGFVQDLVLTMFDVGVAAAVPVDTVTDPRLGTFDICNMRVGKILEWYPQHVKVKVYNEQTGKKEDLILPKRIVAIVPNPFYSVMNQPNSVLQRLLRKLSLLDVIDEQAGSKKLNMIIQLPYVIKGEAKRAEAADRLRDIENQLAKSPFGIAYADGAENIIQLNRSLDNNLMSQIEYLTNMLYSQLCLSPSILDGTADEKTMLNYNNRVISPILTAITEEFTRKFLTKTARTQGQRIKFMQDPFRLVPVSQVAEIADKFTRAQILSANELRAIVGFRPVNSEEANKLVNPNLNQSKDAPAPASTDPNVNEQNGETETETFVKGLIQQSALSHHGVLGQRWGEKNGPPYPLNRTYSSDLQKKAEAIQHEMDTEWSYGVLDRGKKKLYGTEDLDSYDWSNYRTTPINTLQKTKTGTCWDFVNYQYAKLKEAGADPKAYMVVMKKDNNISNDENNVVTHTFVTFKNGDKTYWSESAMWKYHGLNEIKSVDDVVTKFVKTYGDNDRDVYEFDPTGLDKNLTDKEYFKRATDSEPIIQKKSK